MGVRVTAVVFALLVGGCEPIATEGSAWDDPWRDARGEEVPDRVLKTFAGPDHCGWESVVFLALRRAASRTYVRDPEGVLADALPVPFDRDARLPADARNTGYHLGRSQLWISAKQADRAVYVVRSGRAERWPRFEGACA